MEIPVNVIPIVKKFKYLFNVSCNIKNADINICEVVGTCNKMKTGDKIFMFHQLLFTLPLTEKR